MSANQITNPKSKPAAPLANKTFITLIFFLTAASAPIKIIAPFKSNVAKKSSGIFSVFHTANKTKLTQAAAINAITAGRNPFKIP